MKHETECTGANDEEKIVDWSHLSGDISIDAFDELLLECPNLRLRNTRLHVDLETLHFKNYYN